MLRNSSHYFVPGALVLAHRPLLLNWFHAKGRISAGAVEVLNNKKASGFRTYKGIRVAYYHALCDLPEPTFARRFC